MTQSGGFNFGNVLGQIGQAVGGSNIGGTVGAGEKPEYNFPSGMDKLPESIKTWFLRSDNGQTGLNEFLRNADPKVIDEFRSAVNSGLIQPKNAAANQIIQGYGGLRAGDAVGPGGVLGNLMDDKPSGMTEGYWQQANTLINTMLDYKTKQVEQSGYLDGMPTVQREQMMNQMAQGWKQQFTNEFMANESKRAAMAGEGLTQQQIDNQNLQSMAKIMGGTVDPSTGKYQQTEEGRQFDTNQTGYIDGKRTLAGEAQDWSQQKDVANAAANPRDYIYAQMLGNARGGLAGQPATNQLQMPNAQPPGGPNAANGFMPGPDAAARAAGAGAPGAGQPGMNPLASTQPPGTSGAGTMAADGAPLVPGANPNQWADMFKQAQTAQDAARQGMIGAQQGPGAGAASGLSPGPGSPEMVGGYPGFQGMGTLPGAPGETPEQMINDPGFDGQAAAERKRAMMAQMNLPQIGQLPDAPREPGAMPDGMTDRIQPWNGGQLQPMGGQFNPQEMPQGLDQRYRETMQQAGQDGQMPQKDMQWHQQERMLQQGQPGGMQQLQPTQMPLNEMQWNKQMPQFRAPGQPGMPGQAPAPGGMPGQAPQMGQWNGMQQMQQKQPVPGQTPGMPQPQQGVTDPQYTTSAFTQQLLKNRMVPGSGAIQGQGNFMTQEQMKKQVMPNKVRAQDFMRGRDSEQKGFLGVTSAAGMSDEDAMGAMKNNMPKFQAPGAGKMI